MICDPRDYFFVQFVIVLQFFVYCIFLLCICLICTSTVAFVDVVMRAFSLVYIFFVNVIFVLPFAPLESFLFLFRISTLFILVFLFYRDYALRSVNSNAVVYVRIRISKFDSMQFKRVAVSWGAMYAALDQL